MAAMALAAYAAHACRAFRTIWEVVALFETVGDGLGMVCGDACNVEPLGLHGARTGRRWGTRVGAGSGRRDRGRYDLGDVETLAQDVNPPSADGSVRSAQAGAQAIRPASSLLRSARDCFDRLVCALVGVSLTLNLLLVPRVAYAVGTWAPMPDVEVTSALLEAAFAWVGSAFTGVSAAGLGAVGGAAALGGYSLWAAENPEDAANFQAWVADNVLTQDVDENGVAHDVALNLSGMSPSLSSSIVGYIGNGASSTQSKPVLPSNAPNFVAAGLPTSDGAAPGTTAKIYWSDNIVNAMSSYNLGRTVMQCSSSTSTVNGRSYLVPFLFFFPEDGIDIYFYSNKPRFRNTTQTTKSVVKIQVTVGSSGNCTISSPQTITIPAGSYEQVESRRSWINGVNCGEGFESVAMTSGVSSVVSQAFNALVNGTGTASELVEAANVSATKFLNVSIDTTTGTPTVDSSFDMSSVTYGAVAVAENLTGSGSGTGEGGTTAPVDGILAGVNRIIELMAPIAAISSIPPYLGLIESGVSTITDSWPDVMDILDGISLIPPMVSDILDDLGTMVDIPTVLGDVLDTIVDIPATLGSIVDNLTIDLPFTLGQILEGVTSVPATLSTLLSQILAGTLAIPSTIASELDLDWVLDGLDDLQLRLPDLSPTLILPQATWAEFVAANTSLLNCTPAGPIWSFGGAVLDVIKGDGSPTAPRYVFTLPWIDGRTYTFVVDFADLGYALPVISHAFCYICFAFFYVRFFRRVREWYKSILWDPMASLPLGGDD